MARRWLLLLLGVVLLVLGVAGQVQAHGTVQASSQPVTGYYTCSGQGVSSNMPACVGSPPTSGGIGGYPYVSISALCTGYKNWIATNPGTSEVTLVTCPASSGGVMTVSAKYNGGGPYNASSTVSSGTYQQTQCPANSTSAGGTNCTCNAGFKPNGTNACQSVGSCSAVISAAVAGWAPNNYLPVSSMDVTQCYGGCEVRAAFVVKQDGVMYMAGPEATGATCQGNNSTGTTLTGEPFPQPVPPGKCPGTVNGQPVIVECSQSQTGSQSNTTNPDGSTTKTDSKTTCTANQGCTTTTSTVACSASGVCNTTTTTTVGANTNAGGNGSSVGGGSGGADDACATNPNRAGCKELGTATGDPITQVTRTVGITPDTGWAHDTTCPADKVLHLAHVTLTVPFTLLCTAADYAKPIVLAVAWLTAIGGFFGLARKGGD